MQTITRGDSGRRPARGAGYALLSLIFTLFLFSAAPSQALLVNLDGYIDLNGPPILSSDGVTPIADGSWVFIIGSGDAVLDPMQMVGTNFIAASVTGDDVILAAIQIPLNVGTNSGYFFTTTEYESTDINYTYIRFFDTPGPLTGQLTWGTSDLFQLGVTLGVSTVNYNYHSNLIANNTNHFVIIPEPSTANLFVVVMGMLWAMRMHRNINRKSDPDDDDSGDDPPPGQGPDAHDDPVSEPAQPACVPNFSNIYRQRAGPPDSATVNMWAVRTHHPPPPS